MSCRITNVATDAVLGCTGYCAHSHSRQALGSAARYRAAELERWVDEHDHHEDDELSGWRRKALLLFPERNNEIRAGLSIYDVLSDLEGDLRAEYNSGLEESTFADRVFQFVAWCYDEKQNRELRNAAAVGFYEHLPNCAKGRRDLSRRLSLQELQSLESLFRQMLQEEDYLAFVNEIERFHGKRIERQPPTT